jgi:4-carboxymuconolactone decarboxylase
MTDSLFDKGLAVRKEVLGADYVNAALANNADEFSQPLQQLVTEFCWGSVWTRPELSRKSRSMINLAMMAALNRPHELKLHLRGALNNDVSNDEIREILLQVAVYCGFPAAIDAMRVAREVLTSEDNH